MGEIMEESLEEGLEECQVDEKMLEKAFKTLVRNKEGDPPYKWEAFSEERPGEWVHADSTIEPSPYITHLPMWDSGRGSLITSDKGTLDIGGRGSLYTASPYSDIAETITLQHSVIKRQRRCLDKCKTTCEGIIAELLARGFDFSDIVVKSCEKLIEEVEEEEET